MFLLLWRFISYQNHQHQHHHRWHYHQNFNHHTIFSAFLQNIKTNNRQAPQTKPLQWNENRIRAPGELWRRCGGPLGPRGEAEGSRSCPKPWRSLRASKAGGPPRSCRTCWKSAGQSVPSVNGKQIICGDRPFMKQIISMTHGILRCKFSV